MRYPSIEFMSKGTIGQSEKCQQLFSQIRMELEHFFAHQQIRAWSGRVVKNDADAGDEVIFVDYYTLTNGIFPFVYFCVQVNSKESQTLMRTFFEENQFEEVSNKEMLKFLGET